jgi:hypothetical protein
MAKAEVFIIESMPPEDGQEGEIIQKILALSGKQCEVHHANTRQSLIKALEAFRKSKYRYLHLSSHGSTKYMVMTGDTIELTKLGTILMPYLGHRRLFVSACEMTNDRLASNVMRHSKCYSILGPIGKVNINDAAILWASLYHVSLGSDQESISRKVLRKKSQEVSDMFNVQLRLFRRDHQSGGYDSVRIRPKR